jgi:integrase
MSLDKESADVAMEFLAEDPALPSLEGDQVAPPTLNNAQDLLAWISTYPGLGKAQRSNEMSAIRALGTIDNTPLSAIPLEEEYLFNDRYKAIRAGKSLKKRRRGNIITVLNRVLKRAGIIKVGSRRSGKISVAWIKWLESLSKREDIYGLTPFARFCSERNIEPHQVTLDVWYDFVDETLHHSGVRKPRGTVGRVVAANNRARAKVHNWPLSELPKLVNPRTVSIPKSEFPAPFWKDIDTYIVMSSTPAKNIFDTNWPKQLSLDTLQRYRDVAWRTASAQVREGRPASEITSLAALLDVAWLEKAMNWFYHHAGDTFLKDHLNIAATWVSFADNYVHPPAEAIDQIRKGIFKVIEKKLGPADFSKKNIEKLEQFSNPAIVEDFLFLPYQIMAEIKKKKVITVDDATEMMAAVGIELLLTTMIRRKNLADLNLKKHFWPAQPTPAGAWSLVVDAHDVKNHQPLRFAMSKPTIRLIDFYLKKCRPLLLKKPTDMLFLRTNGEPKGRVMIANLISRTIRRRLDLDINVHLFRHIGTMLYLDTNPGHFGVPQVMLGHTSDKTTQKFYAHLQATQAIKHFTAAVLGARDDNVAKLKIT